MIDKAWHPELDRSIDQNLELDLDHFVCFLWHELSCNGFIQLVSYSLHPQGSVIQRGSLQVIQAFGTKYPRDFQVLP